MELTDSPHRMKSDSLGKLLKEEACDLDLLGQSPATRPLVRDDANSRQGWRNVGEAEALLWEFESGALTMVILKFKSDVRASSLSCI